jgi:hypothetical protein
VDLTSTGIEYAPAFVGYIEIMDTTFADTLPFIRMTTATGHVTDQVNMYTTWTGSEMRVNVEWMCSYGALWAGNTYTCRYFIFVETAFT